MQDEYELLRAGVYGCGRCRLSQLRLGRGAVAPYVGPSYRAGGLLLLGERPGAQEGEAQEPFVGGAGQLLTRLLHRAGLDRAECAIDYRLRCRPPEDRLDEIPEALFACSSWTREAIEVLRPSVVVLLGKVAIQMVFGPDTFVAQARHRVRAVDHEFAIAESPGRGNLEVPGVELGDDSGGGVGGLAVSSQGLVDSREPTLYVGTYHPAHALRHKHVEALITADLRLAKELRDG